MAEIKSEAVQVDGLKVRFQRAGSGPALVLVHGLLAYSFSWRFAMPLLAESREVFAMDMPGSGFSECDSSLDCTIAGAARRLARFMEAVGIPACDLLGSSYGGAASLMLATQAPEHIRSLTLVSPANPWSKIGRKRLALLNVRPIGSAFPSVARLARPVASYFLGRMYGDPHKLTQDAVEGYARALVRPGRFEHGVKIAQCWWQSMAELETSLPAAANIPTLLVWGSKDRMVELASAERLKRHFQHAKLAVMQGAGHIPYEERPEEFCRIVLEFLREHSPAQVLDGK